MLTIFYLNLCYDLKAIFRYRSQWLYPIVFFIIFISLFGIGLGFDSKQLVQVSPAIIWVAFLLTSLFTIEAVLRKEEEEGILEQLVLSPYPLWWLILAKSWALWMISCLPLITVIPLLGLILQLSTSQILIIVISLLLGSPALTFVGVMGAALTITMSRSGVFLSLLLLPLYIPILILGESAVITLLSSEFPIFEISLLSAISILAITAAPHATAAALKIAMES